jgi:hypothetical protein
VISSSPDRRRALLLLSSLLAAGRSFGQSDAALRTALERSYVNWLQAMRSSDVAAFSAYTSRYRQMCLRNEIVSMRQVWPAAVFKSVIQAPDVSRLRFMDATASGDTARLVYFGQVDFALESDIATPENPLVVRFLREEGQWKFDWIQYVNLGKDENVRRQIRGGGRTWLEGDEFRLSGVYPAVPRPCREPYQIAALAILARGCRVTVDVNRGAHIETVDNNTGGRIITGGLQKGANIITISPEVTAPAGTVPVLEISVLSRAEAWRPAVKLWSWKPAEAPAQWKQKYESSIFVKSRAAVN